MGVTLRPKNMAKLLDDLDLGLGARPTIGMGLQLNGPAIAYGLVWEWGRVDINPGPKTTWGTNPDGERVVLTITAPMGWIRVHKKEYGKIIQDELEKAQFWKMSLKQMGKAVEKALRAAGPRIADLMANTAPIDTGELRAEIRASITIPEDGELQNIADRLSVRSRIRV